MKRILISSLVALSPLTTLASDHDFNAAVSSIESAYHVHRQHVPLIGLVSFCAHIATGGAVKGLKIAAFNDDPVLPEGSDLPKLLQGTLGSAWSLVVDTRSNGEQDAIYARPEGSLMRLLIASYDHGDLSVVRVDLDGAQLAKWINDRVGRAQHRATN